MLAVPHCAVQRCWNAFAWAKPESKTLECLVRSVYDGLISPRAHTETWWAPNPTIRWLGHLATKVFRGLQVWCSARTLVQFYEPPTSQVMVCCPRTAPKQDSKKNWGHGHCFPKNWRHAGEGAVGGDLHMQTQTNIQCLGCTDRQHWYDDEMIEFWPLLCTCWWMGKEAWFGSWHVTYLSTWHWSLVTHPTSCPPAPDQHGNRVMVVARPRGEVGKTCGRKLTRVLYSTWWKQQLGGLGWQRVEEWFHRSALWCKHFWWPQGGMWAHTSYVSVGPQNTVLCLGSQWTKSKL